MSKCWHLSASVCQWGSLTWSAARELSTSWGYSRWWWLPWECMSQIHREESGYLCEGPGKKMLNKCSGKIIIDRNKKKKVKKLRIKLQVVFFLTFSINYSIMPLYTLMEHSILWCSILYHDVAFCDSILWLQRSTLWHTILYYGVLFYTMASHLWLKTDLQ